MVFNIIKWIYPRLCICLEYITYIYYCIIYEVFLSFDVLHFFFKIMTQQGCLFPYFNCWSKQRIHITIELTSLYCSFINYQFFFSMLLIKKKNYSRCGTLSSDSLVTYRFAKHILKHAKNSLGCCHTHRFNKYIFHLHFCTALFYIKYILLSIHRIYIVAEIHVSFFDIHCNSKLLCLV